MAKQVLLKVPAEIADIIIAQYPGVSRVAGKEKKPDEISIPYPDEESVLHTTQAKWDSLVRDLGFPTCEFLCQQLSNYSETNPVKFRKYKDHALVLRKWYEMKVADGYVFSPKHGHYVKRWVAREDGVL